MKRHILIVSFAVIAMAGCHAGDPSKAQSGTTVQKTAAAEPEITIIHLSKEDFKQKVFNYETGKEWIYSGSKPAIIDFYADWCAPCRQLSPVIEELAKEYKGQIIVYKVDTEKERELAQNLGVQALPTVLLVPMTGHPQVIMGFMPKSDLVKAIQDVLL
ncbi:MAG TPA: thioredoxin [Bacteroidales bacterium]|nr:thioredoxin [Bacteroidales bacterium]